MWIIPENLPISHSVQATGELTSDSRERLAEHLEQSVMWRSKPSRSATWSRRLKTDLSTQRLSSRILNSSLGQISLDEWISSLEGSLVNHSQPREGEQETKIQDTCFPISSEESESWSDLPLFSSKMSRESSHQSSKATNGAIPKERLFSSMSSESWSAWVTTRRREYSQRVKSALPINESACSSWVVAPISGESGRALVSGLLERGGESSVGYSESRSRKGPSWGREPKLKAVQHSLRESGTGTAYPAPRGAEQYPREPPRVTMVNTDYSRLQGDVSSVDTGRSQSANSPPATRSGTRRVIQGNIEPPMGGNADGAPSGLGYAELCYVMDNRTDELRLLGNGVVPDTAERAFRTLWGEWGHASLITTERDT